jgi:hypothetical protein
MTLDTLLTKAHISTWDEGFWLNLYECEDTKRATRHAHGAGLSEGIPVCARRARPEA